MWIVNTNGIASFSNLIEVWPPSYFEDGLYHWQLVYDNIYHKEGKAKILEEAKELSVKCLWQYVEENTEKIEKAIQNLTEELEDFDKIRQIILASNKNVG